MKWHQGFFDELGLKYKFCGSTRRYFPAMTK
jgi:hypothetical protein